MAAIPYYKLVRDKIPDIIRSGGKDCICRRLTKDEYLDMLDQKLNEELREYQESKSLEELADLMEVIYAVVKARGSSAEEVEQLRLKKALERGGFDHMILLEEVQEKE